MATQSHDNDRLAYNVAGIAYDHLVEEQYEGAIIRVREVTGKMLKEEHTNITTTLLSPSTEEQGTEGDACVWVGMRPESESARPPKKGTPINAITNPHVISHDPYALRVVCVLSHAMNKYYALTGKGEQGLCQAEHVKADGVFFFQKFRDDSIAAKEKRSQEWSRKISSHKTSLKSKDDQVSLRTPDQAHAEAQSQQNPISRIKGLIARHLRVSHPEYLDKLQHLLTGCDEDLVNKPVGSESLILLFNSKEVITSEHAEAAAKEIESLWPEVQEMMLKAPEIILMSRGLVHDERTVVEYGSIRPFMVYYIKTLRWNTKKEYQDAELAQYAHMSHDFVRLACGEASSTNPLLPDRDAGLLTFLDTVMEILEPLREYGSEYLDSTTKKLPRNVPAQGLDGVFDRFAGMLDKAVTKHWVKEAWSFLISAVLHREKGVLCQLTELTEGLKAFRKSVASADGSSVEDDINEEDSAEDTEEEESEDQIMDD